jgi:hypothetical protein
VLFIFSHSEEENNVAVVIDSISLDATAVTVTGSLTSVRSVKLVFSMWFPQKLSITYRVGLRNCNI